MPTAKKLCSQCKTAVLPRMLKCPRCGSTNFVSQEEVSAKSSNAQVITSNTNTNYSKTPARADSGVDSTTLAFVVYILYIVGYFLGGITALIGVIIAHVQSKSENSYLQTHYQFQIRTFWIGLPFVVIGLLLAIVIVGYFILLPWFIWSLIRVIKGLLLLNKREAIPNPVSWGFGG